MIRKCIQYKILQKFTLIFSCGNRMTTPFLSPESRKKLKGHTMFPFYVDQFNQILELGNFCLFSCQNSFVYVRGIID